MLQNSRASPIFGFTERPFLAHWELKFALAAGNTVSPPSSTSELHKQEKMKGNYQVSIQNPTKNTMQDHNLERECQLTGT